MKPPVANNVPMPRWLCLGVLCFGTLMLALCFYGEARTFLTLNWARKVLSAGPEVVLQEPFPEGKSVPPELLLRRSNLARETLIPKVLEVAEQDARRAIATDPLNASAWRRLAEAAIFLQDGERAEAALEMALRLEPAYTNLKRSSLKLFALLNRPERLESQINALNQEGTNIPELFDELLLLRRSPTEIAKRLNLESLSISEAENLLAKLNQRGFEVPLRRLWGNVPLTWLENDRLRSRELQRALKAYDLPVLALLMHWHLNGTVPDEWPELPDAEQSQIILSGLLDTSLQTLPWEKEIQGIGWQSPPATKAVQVSWRDGTERTRLTLLNRRRDASEMLPEIEIDLSGQSGQNFSWPMLFFILPAGHEATLSLEVESSSFRSASTPEISLGAGADRDRAIIQSTLSREWQPLSLTLPAQQVNRTGRLDVQIKGPDGKMLGKGRIRMRQFEVNVQPATIN